MPSFCNGAAMAALTCCSDEPKQVHCTQLRRFNVTAFATRYLTALPPGVLIQLSDIKEIAAVKLRLQTAVHLARLQSAVKDCTAVTQQLRWATFMFADAAGCTRIAALVKRLSSTLQQLANAERRAASNSLAAGCDGITDGQAVFAALPMPLIGLLAATSHHPARQWLSLLPCIVLLLSICCSSLQHKRWTRWRLRMKQSCSCACRLCRTCIHTQVRPGPIAENATGLGVLV
jgi:hypothetical protein